MKLPNEKQEKINKCLDNLTRSRSAFLARCSASAVGTTPTCYKEYNQPIHKHWTLQHISKKTRDHQHPMQIILTSSLLSYSIFIPGFEDMLSDRIRIRITNIVFLLLH